MRILFLSEGKTSVVPNGFPVRTGMDRGYKNAVGKLAGMLQRLLARCY